MVNGLIRKTQTKIYRKKTTKIHLKQFQGVPSLSGGQIGQLVAVQYNTSLWVVLWVSIYKLYFIYITST